MSGGLRRSGSRHRAQVCAEVDGVGDEKQRDTKVKDGLWIMPWLLKQF
jgi:hypothetical protein